MTVPTPRKWWQRKVLTFPISVWLIALVTFVIVYGIFWALQRPTETAATDAVDAPSAADVQLKEIPATHNSMGVPRHHLISRP